MSVLILVLRDTMLIIKLVNPVNLTVFLAQTQTTVLLVSRTISYLQQVIHRDVFKIAQHPTLLLQICREKANVVLVVATVNLV